MSRLQRLRTLARSAARAPEPPAATSEVPSLWEPGHHHNPLPDTRALAAEPARSRVWPDRPELPLAVDWRAEEQVALVRNELGRQPWSDFPDQSSAGRGEYHIDNEAFGRADAWALQAMLRHLRPKRVIEVGSGWSSLVTARVGLEHLDGKLELTCVEPYPLPFLGDADGISRIIRSPVEEVPLEHFSVLEPKDVLFIDSGHVVKTGNDVEFLFHQVLPRLRPGVVVHVHDIFLPWDYPEGWVMAGRGWNEQYLLESFLAFNSAFQILLAMGWMCATHPDVLAEAMGSFELERDGGGSFWMRREET